MSMLGVLPSALGYDRASYCCMLTNWLTCAHCSSWLMVDVIPSQKYKNSTNAGSTSFSGWGPRDASSKHPNTLVSWFHLTYRFVSFYCLPFIRSSFFFALPFWRLPEMRFTNKEASRASERLWEMYGWLNINVNHSVFFFHDTIQFSKEEWLCIHKDPL